MSRALAWPLLALSWGCNFVIGGDDLVFEERGTAAGSTSAATGPTSSGTGAGGPGGSGGAGPGGPGGGGAGADGPGGGGAGAEGPGGGGAGPGGGGSGGGCEVCEPASAIRANGSTCALLEGGAVRCWGPGARGQLGIGNGLDVGDDERPTVDAMLGAAIQQVELGAEHACALRRDLTVQCWGANGAGQLGYGNTSDVGVDQPPSTAGVHVFVPSAQSIAVGGRHSCALLEDSTVRCWGAGESGQLGHGADTGELSATGAEPAATSDAIVRIAAGEAHTCGELAGNRVVCWGRGADGRLGGGPPQGTVDVLRPSDGTPIQLPGPVEQLAAGGAHTCALLLDGRLWCWGQQGANGHDEPLGDNEAVDDAAGVALAGDPTVLQVSTGSEHTCAVIEGGRVRCWGQQAGPALGYPGEDSMRAQNAPDVAVHPVLRVVEVSAGKSHTCALLEDGSLRCWGTGLDGRLGYGDELDVGDDEDPADAGPVL